MKALLLENIHADAADALRRHGFDVETRSGAVREDDLLAALDGVALLGVRSNTAVPARVLKAAEDLIAVGCFCVGTNHVALDAASERGIAVFNAPYANTRSVVELVIGEIVVLARRLEEKSRRMHEGVWDKSAKGAHEFRGRTLGIVGYGNIGTQLSTMAEAVGMRVLFHDTADRLAYGNARSMPTLGALLAEADVVSIHVDGRPGNAGMFGAAEFAAMKPRSFFINASRGMVTDEHSLRDAVVSGHVAGAAVDVFPTEPKAQGDPFDSPLRGLDNVILTPHIAGSTQEAQEEIGRFVAGKLLAFAECGATGLSVNLPEVAQVHSRGTARVAHLHTDVTGTLATLNQLLAERDLNVVGQSLSTRDGLGYSVTDIGGSVPADLVKELNSDPRTVWARTWTG